MDQWIDGWKKGRTKNKHDGVVLRGDDLTVLPLEWERDIKSDQRQSLQM